MATFVSQIPVPSNGTPATLFTQESVNSNQINIRNTGTVTVLLGPAGVTPSFPLTPGEYLGLSVAPDDTLIAQVQTNGTAGQVTILGVG